MTFYCYILECSDGTFYTGSTADPQRRLSQHNRGTAARYTRSRRPVRIVYLEELTDRLAAFRRERAIKSMPRKRKMLLIASSPIQNG